MMSPKPSQDRILSFGTGNEFDGSSQEKWMRLNEVLSKLNVERFELNYSPHTQDFIGPSENSLLKSVYLLIQRVQNQQRQQRNEQN